MKAKDRGSTLRETLSYEPVELSFGTSGLRGRVRDITHIEAVVGTKAFLGHLLRIGAIHKGDTVYLAGDLRPSTDRTVPEEDGRGEILQGVAHGIRSSGFGAGYLGKIPSPALACYALRRRAASVMVTGSHIPFDRNGIKFNTPSGEVLKSDESPILALMKTLREETYGQPASESAFDARGMLHGKWRLPLPPAIEEARSEYIARYATAFPPKSLTGMRILAWQHSAVGRDILVEILRALGADVAAAGRSERFIAVDTEAFGDEMLAGVQSLVDSNGGAELDAVVSTDGDSDRPLLLGIENGKARFFPGDLLGAVTAEFLGARQIAIPISANDAVEAHFTALGAAVVKTRIGSPHLIAVMKQVGWEANGGFLTAAPVTVPGGGVLDPLPTRDAMLPLLAALSASRARGESVSAVFARLPRRSGCSGIVRELPREISNLIVSGMSPNDRTIMEAKFEGGAPTAMELDEIRANIRGYFTREDGFGDVSWINWLDGVRIGFSNGDVAHVRPSGNAPELRIYANADTMERARRIVSIFLRRIQAVRAFTSAPCALRLGGAVQNYDWGGFRFIPALLGRENAEQKPHAELWIGAHPRAPSIAELTAAGSGIVPIALDRLIEDAGSAVLGADAARAFGGRLPYLLKVLDARSMLSIQAHPSKDQAREGFARENSLGIPLSSPSRCYVDDNHKPEVHVALTDFWMLHGFRPLEEIAAVCAAAMPELPVGVNAGADPDARRTLLRELYGRIMTMPQPEVDRILGPLITRLSAGARTDKDSPDYWAMEASRLHSGIGGYDRGIFSFYLLNLIHLRPGQGTFQAAGTLHAYLEGVNVELMASSDNVLRGGLTTKHVDTGELLKILTFDSGKPRILDGETVSRTETRYPTTAEEFLLSRIEILPGAPHREMNGHGPDCLIVMEGEAVIHAGDADLALSRGGIALVPAGLPYTVDAGGVRAVLYKAGMPTGQKP